MRAAYVWMTDFVGYLPMPDGGTHEQFLTADYNAEMIEHIERFPHLRDRAIFVGNPEDIVPDAFGENLPEIRGWTERHFDFSGYITGFDPQAFADRKALCHELGYQPDEQVCIVTVGGSGVGGHLLQRVMTAFPEAKRRVPALRMIVVAGPRIDPASLAPSPEGLEVRAYVHELYRHLAACDLAVVQGGLSTCMELAANQRPFLYFPLRHHFEQNFHVRHRLERYMFEGCERLFRPGYLANLVQNWIPALDGVQAKLERGARVADIGCGHGASTIILAKAYPHSRFYGFDGHPASIERARALAEENGIANRATFEVASGTDYPGTGYDLIAYFDCLYDMGNAAASIGHTRDALADDGTVLLVEPAAGVHVEDNFNPVGQFYSGASVLVCTPNALATGADALGTVATDSTLADVVRNAGCHIGVQLLADLQEQGFRGGLSSVYRAMDRLQLPRTWPRKASPACPSPPPRKPLVSRPKSPRQAMWLLVRRPERLTPEQEAYRAQLCAICPDAAVIYPLIQRFGTLMREHRVADLDGWLQAAEESGIPEFVRFARSLRRDQAAVCQALTSRWSQGQTEGFITKLKLLKRSMYDTVGECLASRQQSNEARWTSCGPGRFHQPCHGSQQIERCGRQDRRCAPDSADRPPSQTPYPSRHGPDDPRALST